MTEQERFERYQAAKIGMDYEEIKCNLDEHERIVGERYGKKGQFAKEWELWQAATAQAVPEGYVLVPTANVHTFYQDDDEPENCCNNEAEFDLLGDCVDDGDIIVVNKITAAHLPREKFYGTWVVDASNRKFELFVSYAEAAQAIKAAQENKDES